MASDEWRVTSFGVGRDPIHPALFRKSAELADMKRALKHSWRKERQRAQESARLKDRNGKGIGTPTPVFFVSVASKRFN